MPDYLIRTMTVDDLPAVSAVDLAAFSAAAQLAGLPVPQHGRHRMGLECFRRTASDLCLVADRAGEVVGYAVGHRWGSTTWVGPLGVLPALMGRGIGTALMNGFCTRSIDSGAEVIGLETSITQNLRLYERRGFLARGIRLLAGRDLSRPAAGSEAAGPQCRQQVAGAFVPAAGGECGGFTIVPWSLLGHAQQRTRAAEARALSGLVSAGLDHTAEFSAVPASGMGTTYLALDGSDKLAGYAVLHLRAYRSPTFLDGAPPAAPLVWAAMGSAEATAALLAACEQAALAAGASHLRVPSYGGNPHSWALLRQLGYDVEMAYVRMSFRGQYTGSAGRTWGQVPHDLSSWLG